LRSSPPNVTQRLRRISAWVLLALLAAGLARDRGPARFSLSAVGFGQFQGWADDRLLTAIAAFLKSCAHFQRLPDSSPLDIHTMSADFGRVGDWRASCEAAANLSVGDAAAAHRFFEQFFTPLAVADYDEHEGLFTGYYEIELNGSRRRWGRYQTPIYRRPPELGSGFHPSRANIEDGALAGRGLELFWVDDPINAFFLQIQGSGIIRLRNGRLVRVGYDGQNGRPYVPVGRLLIERGAIERGALTMTSIRAWMKEHSAAGAALRREDASYVFFREVAGAGPIGAEGVALTPERSIAVDRAFIPLGIPIWVEADERFAPAEPVRRLVVAQDTGGAIKGPVRGDLFWGSGSAAGLRAGATNARGRYYLLLPRVIAARLVPEAK
jgi:membrane-bound lytic murein transglycosylase A